MTQTPRSCTSTQHGFGDECDQPYPFCPACGHEETTPIDDIGHHCPACDERFRVVPGL